MKVTSEHSIEESLNTYASKFADNFQGRKDCVEQAFEEVKSWASQFLSQRIMTEVATFPQESLEEKKALCSWLNTLCHDLGLAILCPKTSLPAKINAWSTHKGDIGGHFCYKIVRDSNQTKGAYLTELDSVLLVPDSPERLHYFRNIARSSKPDRELG